jgi:cation-transporting ATPase I
MNFAKTLASKVSRHRRRAEIIWEQEGRVHVRLRSSQSADSMAAREGIERALEQLPHVVWARVNARLGCVVVQSASSELDTHQLIGVLEQAERTTTHFRAPVAQRHPERHPGDRFPLARTGIEIAVDVASIATSAVLRRLGAKTRPIAVDLAALLELATGVPQVRKALEQVGTIAGTELALEVARAVVQSLLHSEMGPVVTTLRRSLALRELIARRTLWQTLEPVLCASPDDFAMAAEASGERPCATPKGPVEPYTDKASMAAIGIFLTTLLSLRDIEGATAPIFAGVPKPARYGRDAFAAHLGYRLARAGALVIEPHRLRRLDRIDCILVDDRLLGDTASASESLRVAIRSANLRVEVIEAQRDSVAALRSLQSAGYGVCAVGLGPWPAIAASDCGVAVLEAGRAPPWSADIICTRGGESAAALVRAIEVARRVSEEGITLSLIEAAFGGGLAISGLKKRTTRRIMMAASAASILSMANGIRHAHALGLSATSEEPARPKQPDDPPWHCLEAEEVLRRLDSTSAGLSEPDAASRRRPRAPAASQFKHLSRALAGEFKTPMTPVLATAAGLSLVTGAVVDAALIASVFAINGVISGAQQYRAERALESLGRREAGTSNVLRGGSESAAVPREQLVPGDVVELQAGDVVPADCRILSADALEADESSLTGESMPVGKYERPVDTDIVAERSSMLYDGTAIAVGYAQAVVVAVGEETEARRAYGTKKNSASETGVQARLEQLMTTTVPLAAASGAALSANAILRGRPLADVVASGVGLAVAAVPEGLPLLATMAQLAAAGRLSERGALVREPRSVEALGRVNVLCADKTGTLTEGRIRLCLVSDGLDSQEPEALGPRQRQVLAVALRATPSTSGNGLLSHLTDRALAEGARIASVGSHDDFTGWRRIDHLPFEPRRGFHAALARHDGGRLLSVKGAPEVLLPHCTYWLSSRGPEPLSHSQRATLNAEVASLANKGYRVLAVAERIAEPHSPVVNREQLRDLHFCGLVAFADRVRPSARAAVHELKRAGVDVIMVTGDHPGTAQTIASELGMGNGRGVVAGPDLANLDDSALDGIIGHTAVFARVTPTQKVRIVAALQRSGKVVAMTGDGANDAPAIRLADVGIALGANSTPAARAAADMVVTDERIETIVHAILEGRALWASVRDAVSILVGGNVGEILFTLGAGLIDGQSPLNPRQLLLVNLVTDTLPALAIALRPPAAKTPEQLLKEGPESSLGTSLNHDIAWRAGITASSASVAWLAARLTGGHRRAGTVGLVALTGSQLLQTFVLGGRNRLSIAASLGALAVVVGVVQTPGLSQAMGCRPLGPLGLAQAGAAMAASTAVAVLHRVHSGRI